MKATVLALLAAFAFALGNVLQQKGALETPATGDDPHFLIQILRRPVWLAGAACQGGGWVLQAVALDTGSLVVVQSITTMSLVIALPVGKRLTGQATSGSGPERRQSPLVSFSFSRWGRRQEGLPIRPVPLGGPLDFRRSPLSPSWAASVDGALGRPKPYYSDRQPVWPLPSSRQ